MRYRKRPVEFDAIQWTGDNEQEIRTFGGECIGKIYENGDVEVVTLEDGSGASVEIKHVGSKNDFIIKGIAGEFYFCKPDIFHKSNELIS